MDTWLHEAAHLAEFKAVDGWPKTLTLEQVFALQCRPIGQRGGWWNSEPAREMRTRMDLAIKAGALPHTTTEIDIPVVARRVISPGLARKNWETHSSTTEWERRDRLFQLTRPPATTTTKKTQHHITATDFAAWLAVIETEPSPHVAAWFNAMGVAARREETGDRHQPAPQSGHGTPHAEKPRILKKNALVKELQGEWPTIEQDLSEASRKGNEDLKAANVQHGYWDVQKARDWAESRGKLVKSADVVTLSRPWPGKVTKHRAS